MPRSTLSEVGGWFWRKTSIRRYAWQHEYGHGLLSYRYKIEEAIVDLNDYHESSNSEYSEIREDTV